MIKKKFLEKMKTKLLSEKHELMKKSYNALNIDVDFDGDEADEIQGNLIVALNKQLSSRDIDKVRKIDLALQKIENKTYGKCQECEDEILEKRLEINPYFSLCFSCAEDQEINKKRNGY